MNKTMKEEEDNGTGTEGENIISQRSPRIRALLQVAQKTHLLLFHQSES